MKVIDYNNIKYSILVPVHNRLEELKECISSLRNQTYPNYEIIIVDDASDNETKEYLQFLEQIDKKIKLSRNVNKIGTGACKNLLINQATGDYLLFVNPTDKVENELLEEINKDLKESRVDILRFNNIVEGGTPTQKIKEYNRDPYRYSFPKTDIISGEEGLMTWLYGTNETSTFPWSYCMKEKLYDDIEYPKISTFEDIPVMPLLLAKAEKVKGIDYVGYHYMQYDSPIKEESEFDKRLLLAQKLGVLEFMVQEANEQLSHTDISEETKEKFINDLEKRVQVRRERLAKRTKQEQKKK